jgi:hypothetical protein
VCVGIDLDLKRRKRGGEEEASQNNIAHFALFIKGTHART